MRIAILGVGNIGSALAQGAVRAGHDVVLSATDADKAAKVAAEVGASAAASNEEAVRGAEIVVLAVPWGAASDVVTGIAQAAGTAVILDATNPLKDDYSGLATGDVSAAEELQALAPNARVVKALNTVFASRQAEPTVDGVPLDGLFAGDDASAKATVAEFLTSLGYHPIDAGALSAARHLEQLAFIGISLNAANGWSWQSGWKLVGPTS